MHIKGSYLKRMNIKSSRHRGAVPKLEAHMILLRGTIVSPTFTVSRDPNLKGKMCPFSLSFACEDYRNVNFKRHTFEDGWCHVTREMTAADETGFGTALAFQVDATHRGVAECGERVNTHGSWHVCYFSTRHVPKFGSLGLDVDFAVPCNRRHIKSQDAVESFKTRNREEMRGFLEAAIESNALPPNMKLKLMRDAKATFDKFSKQCEASIVLLEAEREKRKASGDDSRVTKKRTVDK